jgi:colanic acid/amylovoran biosynthesis glycosyltransferase
MKIAFVVGSFPEISETFILDQITGLIDRGHDVEIFPESRSKGSLVHPDVFRYNLFEKTNYTPRMPAKRIKQWVKGFYLFASNLHRDPMALLRFLNKFRNDRRNVNLKMLYFIVPFLGRGPFDIVQAHFGPNGIRALKIRKAGAFAGKVITTFHGFDVSQYLQGHGNSIYSELYNDGDLFLPISDFWKRRLIATGCPAERTKVHRMGINLKKLSYRERKVYEGEDIIVLSIARLVEKKGIEFAIRAVAKVSRKYPRLKYKIVGTGALYDQLRELVQDLGQSDSVEFLGPQTKERVFDLLYEASIFVAPSVTSRSGDMEGIPVAIMEAMAVGLPVLSTWHSGIPELVQDGVSGFLVTERDSDALGEKLEYLVEHPNKWAEMGRAGRAHVEEKYDIEKLNDRLVKLFENLLDKK